MKFPPIELINLGRRQILDYLAEHSMDNPCTQFGNLETVNVRSYEIY